MVQDAAEHSIAELVSGGSSVRVRPPAQRHQLAQDRTNQHDHQPLPPVTAVIGTPHPRPGRRGRRVASACRTRLLGSQGCGLRRGQQRAGTRRAPVGGCAVGRDPSAQFTAAAGSLISTIVRPTKPVVTICSSACGSSSAEIVRRKSSRCASRRSVGQAVPDGVAEVEGRPGDVRAQQRDGAVHEGQDVGVQLHTAGVAERDDAAVRAGGADEPGQGISTDGIDVPGPTCRPEAVRR